MPAMENVDTLEVLERTLNLDVEPAGTGDLRRRLQARSEIHTTAVLPGGAIFEDTPETLTYHFHVPGAWRQVLRDGETRLEHEAGHVLTLRDGRLQLTLTK